MPLINVMVKHVLTAEGKPEPKPQEQIMNSEPLKTMEAADRYLEQQLQGILGSNGGAYYYGQGKDCNVYRHNSKGELESIYWLVRVG